MRSLAILFSLLAGCAASRMYRMPLDGDAAHRTFAPLVSVCQTRGLEVHEWPTYVWIKADDATNLKYEVEQDGRYVLWVMIDDKKVPHDTLEAKFQNEKALADQLFQEAVRLQGATTVPAVVVQPVQTGIILPAPPGAPTITIQPR